MITLSEQDNGYFIINLDETFDFESHKDFRNMIKKIVVENAKKLSIDFAKVEYIDSSALGMMMLARHETETIKCELTIINLKEGHAKNVLNLVKFDQMFKIED